MPWTRHSFRVFSLIANLRSTESPGAMGLKQMKRWCSPSRAGATGRNIWIGFPVGTVQRGSHTPIDDLSNRFQTESTSPRLSPNAEAIGSLRDRSPITSVNRPRDSAPLHARTAFQR